MLLHDLVEEAQFAVIDLLLPRDPCRLGAVRESLTDFVPTTRRLAHPLRILAFDHIGKVGVGQSGVMAETF